MLVIMVIISVILTVKIWIPLRPPAISHVTIRQGSTVVLTEINTEFHQTVAIKCEEKDNNLNATEAAKSDDVVVDFYRFETSCDSMIKTDVVSGHSVNFLLTDRNISSYPPVYALSGSTFEYQISGDNSAEAQVKFVRVCMYSGSDFDEANELECKKVLLRGGSGYFPVVKSDYYFFRVESHRVSVQYSLSISENPKVLNINTKGLFDCAINATNNFCQFELPKKNMICLIAVFYPTANDLYEMKLQVQVTKSREAIMLILPLSIVSCIILIISIVLIVLVFCCCVRIRNLYKHSTVV